MLLFQFYVKQTGVPLNATLRVAQKKSPSNTCSPNLNKREADHVLDFQTFWKNYLKLW
jgi:hypothetical protein